MIANTVIVANAITFAAASLLFAASTLCAIVIAWWALADREMQRIDRIIEGDR